MKRIPFILKMYRQFWLKPKCLGIKNWLAILPPRQNLNCLGIQITPLIYMDWYESWGSEGIYIRIFSKRRWMSLRSWGRSPKTSN